MNIYENGSGDELINPLNYNDQIALYLKAESEIFGEIIKDYYLVVEIGCMDGRYTDFVLKSGKKYLGIDAVQRYIENAKKKYKSAIIDDKAAFFSTGLKDLEAVIADSQTQSLKKTVAVFPFNSFGNIENIEQAIDIISNSLIDFVIFTYKTDKATQLIRENYYSRSGFVNLDCIYDETGVRFISSEGLDSVAYSEKWLREKFESSGRILKAREFGAIGQLFCILKQNFIGKL